MAALKRLLGDTWQQTLCCPACVRKSINGYSWRAWSLPLAPDYQTLLTSVSMTIWKIGTNQPEVTVPTDTASDLG
jgi:hypothetical protein